MIYTQGVRGPLVDHDHGAYGIFMRPQWNDLWSPVDVGTTRGYIGGALVEKFFGNAYMGNPTTQCVAGLATTWIRSKNAFLMNSTTNKEGDAKEPLLLRYIAIVHKKAHMLYAI